MKQCQLPQRELTEELRQIEESGAADVVGTQPTQDLLAPQQLQVRNGSKAVFSVEQSIPVQWVQSVATRNASLSAPGVPASGRGGGVKQGLIWIETGHKISVQPPWPGGKQDATVEVEVQSSAAQAGPASDLPAQLRSSLGTTVGAPVGQWVTLAAIGASAQRGVYGSEAPTQTRRLLQLRVSAP